MPFTLGQRWISDTESELGLGIVVAIDQRSITLFFPLNSENRVYTQANAPLTRVRFQTGDLISSADGWQLQITDITEQQGVLTYHGHRTDDQQAALLPETQLSNALVFRQPQDKLFAGQIDRLDRFALRYQARLHQCQQLRDSYRGLRGARASLIPHQLYIAHEVAQRHAPRVLLADEVGLGKTIEAGLILHQLILSGRVARVLIVVPENLQHQWLVEMRRRFNLPFSLFDDERYQQSQFDSDNPFDTAQWIICSTTFVSKQRQRLAELVDSPWDLLIVDEAHHLVWQEDAPSREYRAIEQLAEQIPAVLLLTATPEQLGQASHFARLRLLDPARFYDYAQFVDEQQQFQLIAQLAKQLLSDQPVSPALLKQQLTTLMDTADLAPLLSQLADPDPQISQLARQRLIAQLVDRHGTSRVLFRNSRAHLQGFPARQLTAVALPFPAQYQTAINVSKRFHQQQDALTLASQQLYPEEIYQSFEGDNASWGQFDPRINWIIDYLLAHRQAKVVIICAHAQTVQLLEKLLREREGLHAAVFHEQMSLLERDRAAAYFADLDSGAQVLICSEIGSEGRNFQFAHQLIMFDLPLNPDLLEQRIGRLDRIGQRQTIQIIVLYLQNSAQERLFSWYQQGLNAFAQTCPVGKALYDHYQTALLNYLLGNDQQTEYADFNQFIQQCQQHYQQLLSQVEQGRDWLLEYHSHGGERAQALLEQLNDQQDNSGFINFALKLFDTIGIRQQDQSEHILHLSPGENMLIPLPDFPEEGYQATFERPIALAREDVQFITGEHPLIHNSIDLLLADNLGVCSVSLLKNLALPVGSLFLEVIYLLEAPAEKALGLHRFLPPTPIRLLLDKQGNNLADKVSQATLHRQLTPLKRHNANQLVQALRGDIEPLLKQADQHIIPLIMPIRQQAQQQAEQQLQHELQRLATLQRVNPTIREEELQAKQQQQVAISEAISQAHWHIDAINVVLVTHQ